MKPIRILSVALMLSLATLQGACSDDKSKNHTGEQNQYVDDLYTLVKGVERDLSQGYLLRNATDREKKSFTDILYNIKVSTLRLKQNPQDAQALSALYLYSQEYNKLNVLELDSSQLGNLKDKLFETLSALAGLQGKTLDNIEHVLFNQLFTYSLAPFTTYTVGGKAGWVKAYHEDISYAAMTTRVPTESWLFTPTFDLSKVVNPTFKVSQAINSYGKDVGSQASILVSENYNGGDPAASAWDVIPVERMPDGSGFTVVDSEDVSLKKYEGKKIVIAFHFNAPTSSSPVWQINQFQLMGAGEVVSIPLTLTGATGGGATGGASGAPSQKLTSSAAAQSCAGTGSVNLFDKQFTDGATGDAFKVIDATQAFGGGGTKYPGVVRFTGYDTATKNNKVGVSWIVSKDITLGNAKEVCLSVAEDIYLGKGATLSDLSKVQILVSTDYTGDVNTATWRDVALPNRKAATGLVFADNLAAKPSSLSIKNLIGTAATKVTIALKYTVLTVDSVKEPTAWWGIGGVTVAAITDAAPVLTNVPATPNTPASPATPSTPAPAGAALSLTALENSTWESTCYKFGTATTYSKKFWSFGKNEMTSLLLKYSDADCKVYAPTFDKVTKALVPVSTWIIGSVVTTAFSADWSVAAGTCTKGCTAEYKTALRLAADSLSEGSRIKTTETYNIGDGQFVSYSKVTDAVNLEEKAAALNASAVPPAAN